MTTIDPKLFKSEDGRTVLLKDVRLRFSKRLYKADKTSDQSDKLTHGATFLLEPNRPHFEMNKALVMHAIIAASRVAFKNENAWQQIAEDAPKRVCYRDGSKWKNKQGKQYAGFEGGKAFSANGPGSGLSRPKLFTRDRVVVTDIETIPAIFYDGVYCDVIASFFGTEKGDRGIFAVIESIRSHQVGDRMGSGYEASADDFDDFGDGDSFDVVAAGGNKPTSGGGGAATFTL